MPRHDQTLAARDGLSLATYRWSDLRTPRSVVVLTAAVLVQAALGIWTLLAHVPLALGLAHQAGAAAVFGLAVWHLHALRHAAPMR